MYERTLNFPRGTVSGDTNKLKEFTADVNASWDDFIDIAINSSGTWQFDDSSHTDYPIIKANIVSGQQDYSFTTDQGGNLILDIMAVAILPSATATTYTKIFPVDQQTDEYSDIFEEYSGSSAPSEYDKTANGIILSPTPDYNATNGLKLAINREASYFVHTDTTKKPGVPGTLQAYFYLKPALMYAMRNNSSNLGVLRDEVDRFEDKIADHLALREKDKRHIMSNKRTLYI